MRTESTFSFGALELGIALVDPVAVVPVAVELVDEADLSSVPLISTLWPTCGLSFESSASSRYVLPAPAVPVGLAADVPLDEPDVDALAKMNFVSLELVALVVPLVPVAPAVALDESR